MRRCIVLIERIISGLCSSALLLQPPRFCLTEPKKENVVASYLQGEIKRRILAERPEYNPEHRAVKKHGSIFQNPDYSYNFTCSQAAS